MTSESNSDGNAPGSDENRDELDRFAEAVKRFETGHTVVVDVESESGSASPLIDLLPRSAGPVNRVVCGPTGRAEVGGVVEDFGIDEFRDGVIVLENAQWADPTSLGRLQRLVRKDEQKLLLVLAHPPLSGVEGWWIDQLASAAGGRENVIRLSVGGGEESVASRDLDPGAADLIVASGLLTGPISVPIAAQLLQRDQSEVIEIGESLVEQGLLGQTRGGYVAVSGHSGLAFGEARIGHVADRLAHAMEAAGESAAIVGGLRLAAGQPAQAFPLLKQAAVDAERRQAAGEAFHLAESALRASDETGAGDPDELGELHLICGRFLRSAGRTEWARAHLSEATALIEGVARIDALGFAAAVADDAQHPQEAERTVALAEHQAAIAGETAKLGSLLTFRARLLNRLGFAEESEASLAKGMAILEEGSSAYQRFNALQNKAWIHFDRGEAKEAEVAFGRLRDEARELEGEPSVADKEAWRARALFASGHPTEALGAISTVEELAARHEVEAPLFLAQLGLADAGLTYGRHEEALAAAERVLDLVERQLPAWENLARSLRATALFKLGRLEEARREIAAALDATPEGSDGWRYRIRCRALQMEIEAEAGGRWPEREAEDLADLMLQARFYGWAAELLCAIGEHGKRTSAAEEAMAIAVKAGQPMLAARAAHAGSLWSDPAAAPVILEIRGLEWQIPSEWEEDWRALPQVKGALDAPEPTADADTEATMAALDEALRRAGLAGGDVVLSPAQRRSKGLVRRPRSIRPLTLVAAALGVVVIAAGTAFGVAQMTGEEPAAAASATTEPPAVTTTLPPTLEETEIALPEGRGLAGIAPHRGDNARTGFVDSAGLTEATGYYWRFQTGGAIDASPVAFGQQLYVGSTEGTFYALDQGSGNQNWTKPAEGRISTAPALGQADFGEGPVEMMVILVDDEGVVRALRADDGSEEWRENLGARIRSTPVVAEGEVFVATTDGRVHAFELTTGDRIWTYPDGEEGIGVVSADLTYEGGFLYVGTQEGLLHVVDVTSNPPEACQFEAREAITLNVVVADSVAYVPTNGQTIWALPAGSCEGTVPERQPFYVTEAPIDVAPAIVGDTIYLPSSRFLYARSLETWEFVWPADKVTGESSISAPPVVTTDAVYFADEDGVVQAVDLSTGDLLWKWRTGLLVRGSPAVVDDAVFVVSHDTFVYAVGGPG